MQKIGLNQTLAQTTKLSPTQIQVIRMLELPSIELSKRINEELQENPALEEGHEESAAQEHADEFNEFDDNYMPDDGYDEGRQRDPLQNEDFNYEQYISDDETPSYMLRQQYSPADEDQREVPIIGGSSLLEELKSQIAPLDSEIRMMKDVRCFVKDLIPELVPEGDALTPERKEVKRKSVRERLAKAQDRVDARNEARIFF